MVSVISVHRHPLFKIQRISSNCCKVRESVPDFDWLYVFTYVECVADEYSVSFGICYIVISVKILLFMYESLDIEAECRTNFINIMPFYPFKNWRFTSIVKSTVERNIIILLVYYESLVLPSSRFSTASITSITYSIKTRISRSFKRCFRIMVNRPIFQWEVSRRWWLILNKKCIILCIYIDTLSSYDTVVLCHMIIRWTWEWPRAHI